MKKREPIAEYLAVAWVWDAPIQRYTLSVVVPGKTEGQFNLARTSLHLSEEDGEHLRAAYLSKE